MKIKQILEKIPLPFCGVVLSLAALGNLLAASLPWASILLGVLAFVLFIPWLAKIILFPTQVASELENPVIAGVIGTFPMALFAFTPYLAHIQWHLGFALWFVALAIYLIVVINHSVRVAAHANLASLTPAYFVAYVPILMAANTAPLFSAEWFGRILFWIVLLVWIVLFVAVSIRLVKCDPLPKQLLPLLCIYAAPMSMCLNAYLVCFANPSPIFAGVMHIIAVVLFLAGFGVALLCMKLPFFPTFASMTFPFVISATASSNYAIAFDASAFSLIHHGFAILQTLIAAFMVFYVLARYLVFFKNGMQEQSKAA